MKTAARVALAVGAGAGLWLANRACRARYSFKDKVVWITGGSRGLGLLMARELASEGARLVLCARDSVELDRAAAEFADKISVVVSRCDITSQDEVQASARSIVDRWGRIDVLINNAGIIQVGPLETMTIEDFDQAMKVHFWGPLFTTLAVLPHMRRRREGRIVNISSIGGRLSIPHLVPYSASKFALVGLSQGLRAELAKDRILVTTVCPGLMRTGSPRNADFKGRHRQEYAWFSISGSLPIVSMDATRAARQIVAACRRGTADVVLSLPAIAADRIHGMAPGLTAKVLGWVNRVLPRPGGIGSRRAKGHASESGWSPSFLTALNERSALENNEILL